MRQPCLIVAVLLGILSSGTANAQQVTPNALQQVSEQTYQQLGIPQRGASMETDDSRTEQIFNRTYQQTIGSQPDFDQYLQWKYLTEYPDRMVTQRTAAVRQMPEKPKRNMGGQCGPRR